MNSEAIQLSGARGSNLVVCGLYKLASSQSEVTLDWGGDRFNATAVINTVQTLRMSDKLTLKCSHGLAPNRSASITPQFVYISVS